MKKFIALAVASMVSSQAFALSSNVKVVAVDDSEATNLCVVAAKEGVAKAKLLANELFERPTQEVQRMTCNGMSLERFASKMQSKSTKVAQVSNKQVKFVPAADDEASKLCVAAINQGIDAVKANNQRALNNLYCNGVLATRFAKGNAIK